MFESIGVCGSCGQQKVLLKCEHDGCEVKWCDECWYDSSFSVRHRCCGQCHDIVHCEGCYMPYCKDDSMTMEMEHWTCHNILTTMR